MIMNTNFSQTWAQVRNFLALRPEMDVEAAAANIRSNIHFGGMNLWILACAIIIASLGLNVNSTAVIIGAMLISPLMGPIIGMGLAVGTDDLNLMKSSLKNLGAMVGISLIASTLFFVVSPLNMQHPSELLARTNPTIYDVLIALVGGIAGALETTRKEKSTVISGVAIATALMPPLCTVGYGLANLNIKIMAGAFYLFFINCVFVAMATFLVVKYLKFPKVTHQNNTIAKRAKRWASVFLVLLVVPSVLSAITVVRENNFNSKVESFVGGVKNLLEESVVYDYKTDTQTKPYHVTLYIAGRRLTDGEKETLFAAAEQNYGIARHQIIFEVAFTGSDRSELEKQVYTDLNATVKDLKEQIKAYQSKELPYDQLRSEAAALYPQIGDFALSRGKDRIYAIISGTPDSLSLENMEKWLKIRLASEDVSIVRAQE